MDIIRVSLISPGVRRPVVGTVKDRGASSLRAEIDPYTAAGLRRRLLIFLLYIASELWNPGDQGRHWTSGAQTATRSKEGGSIGLRLGPRLRCLLAVLSADGIISSELTLAAKRRNGYGNFLNSKNGTRPILVGFRSRRSLQQPRIFGSSDLDFGVAVQSGNCPN